MACISATDTPTGEINGNCLSASAGEIGYAPGAHTGRADIESGTTTGGRPYRTPLPPRPGAPLTYDDEYRRNGVSHLFVLFAPLGWVAPAGCCCSSPSPDRGGDGGMGHRIRRISLCLHRPVRGAHGGGRRPRPGAGGNDRAHCGRTAAAPGGRRPAGVPAGGQAQRRPGVHLVRAEPPAPMQPANRGPGPLSQRRSARGAPGKAAQKEPQGQGTPQRADALVRQAQAEGRGKQ